MKDWIARAEQWLRMHGQKDTRTDEQTEGQTDRQTDKCYSMK